MDTREWRFMDKSTWTRGPWDSEPDKKQWADPATALPCLIVRNPFGALCGYVGVSAGHPAFERNYDLVDVEDPHGGLTFAGHCQPVKEGICHVVEPGEDDNVWWLGFDCAHGGDYMPGMMAHMALPAGLRSLFEGVYRSMDYVQDEVTRLAAELRRIQADAAKH